MIYQSGCVSFQYNIVLYNSFILSSSSIIQRYSRQQHFSVCKWLCVGALQKTKRRQSYFFSKNQYFKTKTYHTVKEKEKRESGVMGKIVSSSSWRRVFLKCNEPIGNIEWVFHNEACCFTWTLKVVRKKWSR